MEIKTKYNIGDTVYLFINGEVYEEKIKSIDIRIGKNRSNIFTDIEIHYDVSKIHLPGWTKDKYAENCLFNSKKEIAYYLYNKIMQ